MWDKYHWFKCKDCGHRFKRKSPSGFFPCPKCQSRDAYSEDFFPIGTTGTNVPLKGSKAWYDGRWFRRTEKDWHEDIKSRVRMPDGSVTRKHGKID